MFFWILCVKIKVKMFLITQAVSQQFLQAIIPTELHGVSPEIVTFKYHLHSRSRSLALSFPSVTTHCVNRNFNGWFNTGAALIFLLLSFTYHLYTHYYHHQHHRHHLTVTLLKWLLWIFSGFLLFSTAHERVLCLFSLYHFIFQKLNCEQKHALFSKFINMHTYTHTFSLINS